MKTLMLSVALMLPAVALPADPPERETDEARATAGELVQRLGAALKKEMSANGPAAAIAVCSQVAPDLAVELSRRTGARVARVSLKVRNPLLGTPDAWEQEQLSAFDRRAAEGANPASLEHAEVVTEPSGQYFRYIKAIPVQPVCLACHGPADAIGPEVKAKLEQTYPHDRATGYSPGQIRGAVTIKKRL